MNRVRVCAPVAVILLGCVSELQAEVVIETVTVGNRYNPDDSHGAGYGRVNYAYRIGKFEITVGQYAEFLTAVAATDTYGLYSVDMELGFRACNIFQDGDPGAYFYVVEPASWVDRPVTYVSWGDAVRFANWLHNGQPTGAQDLTTTEDGSYFLNGAMSNAELMAVARKPEATWVLPTEDEWYKAAYHDNVAGSSNYYDYPTRSNLLPSHDLEDPDAGNNANFFAWNDFFPDDSWTIGPSFYRTEGGDFENSPSPYGTFDQGGNVQEWNEAVRDGTTRGVRGGGFYSDETKLLAAWRHGVDPTADYDSIGFRVAAPASLTLEGSVPTVSTWGLTAMLLLLLSAGTLVVARNRSTVRT